MQRLLSTINLVWCVAGCAALPSAERREPLDEHVVVHRGDENALSMDIRADNVRLAVGSGDCDYVEIRAKYETEGIEPEITYSMRSDTRAHILAAEKQRADGKHHGLWKVCVDGDTPLRLQTVARGGTFRLSELNVDELIIDGRGGHVELEMLEVEHPMKIRLVNEDGTVGLRLPTSAAFEMQVDRAGQVKYMEVDGLRRRDDGRYVGPDVADGGLAKIELQIHGVPHGVRVREENRRGKWR